ncbi:MAG TPA: hypothetical protein PLA97_19560 [Rubrivivax sp.]|nr:hypothetical protein [Rubrivivax sp.]
MHLRDVCHPSLRARTWRATALPVAAMWVCALAAPAQADPVLTTHFTQATYDVDVRVGSDLLGWSGFSGIGITSYSHLQALTGDGVILQASSGQFVTHTQQLKLHFQAHPGQVFDSVSMSHLLSYFNDRGGYRAVMSWTLDPEDGPAQTGTTGILEDFVWFHGGSFSDATQASPLLAIGNDDAFDLEVTLFYASAGASGGCTTASGMCQQLSANAVKVFVATVPGIDDDPVPIPEPATWTLLLGAALVQGARAAHRGNAPQPGA